MPEKSELYFEHHVFCCINKREEGHPRGCCLDKGSEDLRDYMKSRCKDLGLKSNVRINTSGCLDRCELGPVMVIYPDATWYHYETKQDVDDIITQHIMGGKRVDRLALKVEQKRL